MGVRRISRNNRQTIKRKLLYKPKELGALEIGNKLQVAFCKNATQAIKRGGDWIGDIKAWRRKRGRARENIPFCKWIDGDFKEKHEHLKLDGDKLTNESIYEKIIECEYTAHAQLRYGWELKM